GDEGCVGAATRVVSGSSNILEREVLGLNAAMDFVELLSIKQVTIEVDSSTLVNAVKKRRYTRSYWGKVTKCCGELLDQNPRANINW
ncbi:hypothetical protein A2U01_0059578, partial [Trifolium medium]|nr:hypothetical protein [Trifolium medium]